MYSKVALFYLDVCGWVVDVYKEVAKKNVKDEVKSETEDVHEAPVERRKPGGEIRRIPPKKTPHAWKNKVCV